MKIRATNLALWLLAGLVFWWTRPTLETQIELFGGLVPPMPSEWTMVPYEGTLAQLYLCVFAGLGVIYFWIGGWGERGYSLIWTSTHAIFVFITINLGTDPVRLDWVGGFIQLFAEEGATQERIDFLQDAVGALFLILSACMVGVAVKWKIDNHGTDFIHYFWHPILFVRSFAPGFNRETRQAESAQLARSGIAAGVITTSAADAARSQSQPEQHPYEVGPHDFGGPGMGDSA